ncbi:hypothetical protein CWB96_10905 [Pseudoalteromonas citrea]|uniref:Type II secretion system protein K n=1 Tax=Pseudoalteromonas citrea TaxID=43655 RepID=A0A5S3XS27_9GAMM|nr:type II secretion system protein GspK [Pseudoalteromonas citrea]TMP45685.1 hypothetical protein CWB97_03550 [Pseudoalteromonas citrea]TMP59064.1 hypothetical protein CWB96_10905 [Pseudoalteromonas citrea]
MLRQQGIALIQVLIITAILTVIALFISQTAKQQVQIAHLAMDKSYSEVLLHSSQNSVLFSLLTSPWQQGKFDEEQLKQGVNLYNKPFAVGDFVKVKLQDQAGLINLYYSKPGVIEKRLKVEGVSDVDAKRISSSLFDWIDRDQYSRPYGSESGSYIRNGIMPDKREWMLVESMTQDLFDNISEDFSIFGASHMNLMTSSKMVIMALSNESVAEQVVQLRNAGRLSRKELSGLMQLNEDSDFFFAPTNILQLTVVASYGDSEVIKSYIVELFPYSRGTQSPYNIIKNMGG